MKSKIRYATVVVPDDEHKFVNRNGHEDEFVKSMDIKGIIKVESCPERGWYWLVGTTPYSYHCSWLKFVRKPKVKK